MTATLKEEIDRRLTPDSIMAIKFLGIIPSCFASSEKADDDKMLKFFKDDTCFDSYRASALACIPYIIS